MVFSACQLTKEPGGQTEGQTPTCLSVCLTVCVCMCVYVDVCSPGTSLAGELMKTSVPDSGQISTSVMLAVVTDSQTLQGCSLHPQTNCKVTRVYSATSFGGAHGQASSVALWLRVGFH